MPGLSSEEWELLRDAHDGKASASAPKRSLPSETTMVTEVSAETKMEAATKIAILQREIEKLKLQVER